jgi:hypothetical protein
MNNSNSTNETDNENVRNIVINKKDKKGFKKRQMNISTDNSNQTIGINILKDDYDIKIEEKTVENVASDTAPEMLENAEEETVQVEPVAEEPVAEPVAEPVSEPVAEPVAEEPVAEVVAEVVAEAVAEAVAEVVAEPVDEPVAEVVAEVVAEPVAEVVAEVVAEPVAEAVDEPVVEVVAEAVAEPVVEPVAEVVAEVVAEPVAQDISAQHATLGRNPPFDTFENFSEFIFTNLQNFKDDLNTNYENKLINFNIMEQRLSMNEIKTKEAEERFHMDTTLPSNEHNGLSYIVYAGANIEKNDIVEIYYENSNIFVRPVSANNNNFYGVALESAVKDTKVQVLTNGICRVKIYNNITIPVMKCINGKLVLLKDQKNNVLLQQMTLNISSGDPIIPSKNIDDLILGPTSMYSQFNNVDGTYMIPYKNILFNNISSLYSISNNTKTSVGLRFAYVLDPEIKDNTILVRI